MTLAQPCNSRETLEAMIVWVSRDDGLQATRAAGVCWCESSTRERPQPRILRGIHEASTRRDTVRIGVGRAYGNREGCVTRADYRCPV